MEIKGNEKWKRALYYTVKMFHHRGYEVMDSNTSWFIAKSPTDTCLIWFCTLEKLNVDAMKEFIKELELRKMKNGLVVYQNVMTSSTKKILEYCFKYSIQTIEIQRLQFDLTKHEYYNPHRKLTKDEVQQLKEKIALTSLPIILKTDAVCQYFHFQKGDVLEIIRPSNTIVYRLVR